MQAITKDDIRQRLARRRFQAIACGYRIGLHAWPRAEHKTPSGWPDPHWFGIGPVNWGGEPVPAWYDIRLSNVDRDYQAIDRMLREACAELGIDHIYMG